MKALSLQSVVITLVTLFFVPTILGQTRKEVSVIRNGSVVSFEYTLSDEMGKVIESNMGKEPLTYTHGQGQIVPGLERELMGMKVGDQKDVKVKPEDAFGTIDPKAFLEISRQDVPAEAQKVGTRLVAKNAKGQSFSVRVHEIKEATVVLDLNHPLAGKALSFNVKILGVKPSMAE